LQYKLVIFICLVFYTSATVFAQSAMMSFSHKKEPKVDTIIVRKGRTTSQQTVSQALPISLKMPKPYIPKPKVYKPIPLADEKSYYGDMSGYVNDFVAKYMKVHNRTLNIVHDRSDEQFPLIDNVLKKHEIPKELKYLAVIESALNHNAVSRVGAVGPWQFMAPTARLMGLKVSRKGDERRDLFKSTNAAAKYLTTLYDDLNDWLLVIAAYNSGPSPVKRAMERTGSNNFWDIKQYLPKETQGHVLAFIATATIFEKLSDLLTTKQDTNTNSNTTILAGAKPAIKSRFTPEELSNMVIIKLSEPISMDLMTHELKLDRLQMDKWNEDYDLFEYNTYPSDTYNLRLPKDKLDKFLEMKESLQKRSKQVFSAQNM
jgi:membrane-bound lytic murein transglycosylase D